MNIDLNIKYVEPKLKIVKNVGRPVWCRICYRMLLPEEQYVFFLTRNRDLLDTLNIPYRKPHVTICVNCWGIYKTRIENLLGKGYEELNI
jgi:hypothetical protein